MKSIINLVINIKLIIHIGTHKTASTTFQALCTRSQKVLMDNQILFPDYFKFPQNNDFQQHSGVAWMSQKRDLEGVSIFLQKIYDDALKKKCTTTLISGEDFENFLVEIHLAIEFEDLAKFIGFSEIEWLVVQRNPLDYLLSIYAEKSSYKMVLDIGIMANSILEYGFFSTSSPDYNYKFVFDIKKFSSFFKEGVKQNLKVVNFDNFIDDFVGKALFIDLVNNKSLNLLRKEARNLGIQRKRVSKEKIEFRYLANFLGMKSNKDFHENNKNLVDSLVNHRLNRNKTLLSEIEVKFKEYFN